MRIVLGRYPGFQIVVGRWQFVTMRGTLGNRLYTLTHHDHSWFLRGRRIVKQWHRPFAVR